MYGSLWQTPQRTIFMCKNMHLKLLTHNINELRYGQSKLDNDHISDVWHGSRPLVVTSEQLFEEVILSMRVGLLATKNCRDVRNFNVAFCWCSTYIYYPMCRVENCRKLLTGFHALIISIPPLTNNSKLDIILLHLQFLLTSYVHSVEKLTLINLKVKSFWHFSILSKSFFILIQAPNVDHLLKSFEVSGVRMRAFLLLQQLCYL